MRPHFLDRPRRRPVSTWCMKCGRVFHWSNNGGGMALHRKACK